MFDRKFLLTLICLLAMSVLSRISPALAVEDVAALEVPVLPIAGLTLPEGSSLRVLPEKREELQALMGADKQIDELLVLGFDCESCDWPAMVEHFHAQLSAAGFVDEYEGRAGEQEYLTENGPLLMDMTALMRSWSNPETGQWVALNNITARFDRENPERAKLPDGRTVLRWPVAVNELEPGETQYELQIMTFAEAPAE